MADDTPNLTNHPPAKSVPELSSLVASDKATTYIPRGVCAVVTDVGGAVSNDKMGLNEGPPWWGLIVLKNFSKK